MPADLPPERIQPGSADPIPVPCAGGFVEDSFGVSVVLNVGSVHQVFRWIAPGRFRMGSPVDEVERGSAEVPHEVTLSQGYWIADTACTQAFWLAVWPVNPSQQITPEQVNYHGDYPCFGGEKGLYRQRTAPVGTLPPNPWGLYEMHGNVWEWCADWYADYPGEPQVDPRGPTFGKMRVLRGGTWSDPARYARSATRSRIEPVYRPRSTGFRLVIAQS